MFKRMVYSLLPTPIRVQGRSFPANYVRDVWDQLTGKADPEIPPRHLNVSGAGSFRAFGEHNLMLCRTLGGLQPDDVVLDIGCGIGRTALALTSFLSPATRYIGFDIIEYAIRWCEAHIGKRYPNFSFLHANIYNEVYNRRGIIAADQYSFPFPACAFSFCVATSVFTHVLPPTTEHYIAEASRVVHCGGRFLSTWFLLDQIAEKSIHSSRSKLRFDHRFAHHAQQSLYAPEQAVAYRPDYVKEILSTHGFQIDAIKRGGWSGAQSEIDSGQDVIIAHRM